MLSLVHLNKEINLDHVNCYMLHILAGSDTKINDRVDGNIYEVEPVTETPEGMLVLVTTVKDA